MTLAGYRSANHPQQIARRGPRSDIDDRATSSELFAALDRQFGFTVDVCATAANAKCSRYFDEADDGLIQRWAGERVWCNPPFSRIEPWVAKAWEEPLAEVIVMLLPANRTEQGWWQRLVEPRRDKPGGRLAACFMAGRPRFLRPGATEIGPNERPPFGCVLLVWRQQRPFRSEASA